MRKTFTRTLIEVAERDPRIVLLTGDLGFMVLEPFIERFPDRFFNAGVAEQNMLGMATGLAEAGMIPFCYSSVTVATLRPYEFIRDGAILHRLPVRVVGVGGGFEYGNAGPTHHGTEDVALFRCQPGMITIAPADAAQARTALLTTWDAPTPIYYRFGKDDAFTVPGLDGRFELGRAQTVRHGRDLLLIGLGSIAPEVLAAADALAAQGIDAEVMFVSSFNPDPTDDLAAALERFPAALTVEAHAVNGGLGSLACEVAAENGIPCRIIRCGVRSSPDGVGGSTQYLYRKHGIDRDSLVQTAQRVLALSS